MGNAVTPPLIDYRTERAMRNFKLPMSKIVELWTIFNKHALSRGETCLLTRNDFYANVIKHKDTCLSDQMFKLIGSDSDVSLSFGEFVELVATFACFEKKELLRYLFHILDSNRTGLIEKTEFKHFVHNMWENQVFSNISGGLAYLDSIDDGDGAFNLKQEEQMANRYPMTMAPLYKLQVAIIQNTLGERWWEMHKAMLSDARLENQAREVKQIKLKEEERRIESEVVSDAMILHRMGYLKYYLLPWRRKTEKGRMLRIVAIENGLDVYALKFSRGTVV